MTTENFLVNSVLYRNLTFVIPTFLDGVKRRSTKINIFSDCEKGKLPIYDDIKKREFLVLPSHPLAFYCFGQQAAVFNVTSLFKNSRRCWHINVS